MTLQAKTPEREVPTTDEFSRALSKLLTQDRARKLLLLALYDRTADAPEFFVVRCWMRHWVTGGGWRARCGCSFQFRNRSDAERWIAENFPELVYLSPLPEDDPTILGTWL